jgi:uncharacterized membrane protein YhaH (DUF805 family)
MSEPYYEHEYQSVPSQVPDSSFGQIMKETFLKPFVWNARSTRKTFWIGWAISEVLMIISAIICFVPLAIDVTWTDHGDVTGHVNDVASIWAWVIIAIFVLVLIYCNLCQLGLGVRRLHDTNRSGYWMWLCLIPEIGRIILLILMLLPTAEIPVQWNHYLSIMETK